MRQLLFVLVLSSSGFAQNNQSVTIVPTTSTALDSNSSYIYSATMEMMWFELSQYLNGTPQPIESNTTIDKLNASISNNYQAPIESKFVVARSGLIKDSILQEIQSELNEKFNSQWTPPTSISSDALISYSYLKRDVQFKRVLDDEFNNEPFNESINIDYFGVDLGDPERERKDLIIHDYKGIDDFVIQIKCRDSLDEIYFAKIIPGATLQETYESAIARIQLKNSEFFDGNDILKIPYIKFDNTTNYEDIEGAVLSNESIKGKSFQSVSQRICFDLNPQGIKLKSMAASIIDFADFDNPIPPRILSFDTPFLLIMKRKNSNAPYFLYWVSGTEFMRSYQLTYRTIEASEKVVVGKWRHAEQNSISIDWIKESNFVEFFDDGTFNMVRNGNERKGEWKYDASTNSIELNYLHSIVRRNVNIWELDEINSTQMIHRGNSNLVYEKVPSESSD